MPEISVRVELPMGHRLMHHTGLCQFPHGHNYLIEVCLRGPLNSSGMLVDFSDLKRLLKETLAPFDHCMLLHRDDPFAQMLREVWTPGFAESEVPPAVRTKVVLIDQHPTAEVIAALFKSLIDTANEVVIHETRDSRAVSKPDYSCPPPRIVERW